MKTLKKSALVLGLFALLAGTTTLVRAQDYPDSYQDDEYYNDGNVSLQTFYDELSPYGTWIQDPQYGYVWRPDVNQADFRPYYTNGRWVMTEYGNTWVSNYDWGWAPFHYGRWVYNSYRQWIWLPDTNWGPAWVDWRSGDGYYGWAPMAPSISINISFGRRYVVPDYCWNFIPQANIYVNTFPRYDYGRNNVYIRNTTIINNTYVYNRRTYYGGPRAEDIRRATNRDVRVYRFSQSNRPGASRVGGREVSIYRPRAERNVDNRSAAPKKFDRGNAGFTRNGRESMANRDNRGNNGNDNRFGTRPDRTLGQPNRGNEPNSNRGNNQSANRDDRFNRDANGRPQSSGQNNNSDWRNRQGSNTERGQQQREQQAQRFERSQQDRVSQEQQRNQRDAQMQQGQQQVEQQRSAQAEQQRAQRNEQMQQQRNAQAQEQRQQMEQQRAQRNEQMQQQRQQMEQQRAQRNNEQMQQQRAQQDQQRQQAQQQREAQAQQQRAQQQQQMQQRQEQRRMEAPQQQNRGGAERGNAEGGRSSRGGRG